jgi:hypothetical protein
VRDEGGLCLVVDFGWCGYVCCAVLFGSGYELF